VPSLRSSVVESATPFSAVMTRPSPSPVMVMLESVALVSRFAAELFALASVKYRLVVPSEIKSLSTLLAVVRISFPFTVAVVPSTISPFLTLKSLLTVAMFLSPYYSFRPMRANRTVIGLIAGSGVTTNPSTSPVLETLMVPISPSLSSTPYSETLMLSPSISMLISVA